MFQTACANMLFVCCAPTASTDSVVMKIENYLNLCFNVDMKCMFDFLLESF